MKKIIYSIAFLTLVTALTSCTADDLPKNNTINQIENQHYYQRNDSIFGTTKDGDIDPPIIPTTPPVKP
jgi:hypothetical protein